MKRLTAILSTTVAALGASAALASPATANAPGSFEPWLQRSAAQCSGISASVLAAQIHAESDFSTRAVSRSGAMGPAQFMPGTWAIWGTDGDGNGSADPYSIPDSVMAQGRFMCHLYGQTSAGVNNGTMRGYALDLALAAYNAGLGAVQRAGGMPSGGEYSTQTQPYVAKIKALEPRYRYLDGGASPLHQAGLDFGSLAGLPF